MSRSTIDVALGGLRRWGPWRLGSSVLGVAAVSALVAGLALLGVPTAHATGEANPYLVTTTVAVASLNVSPTSGHPRTSVTVSGQGFSPGENVKITYKTGLASPKSVTICTATVGSDTSYTCSGTIPPRATAGARGAHTMVAKGLTSLIKVQTTFTIT